MIGTTRLFLALVVTVYHLGPLDGFAQKLKLGYIAVWCFYLLSGYLMVLVTQEGYQSQRWRFLASRALRIYPVYWAVLLLSLAGYAAIGIHPQFQSALLWPPPSNMLAQWLLLIDVRVMPWVAVPVAWTLTVELAWYIAIAFGIFDQRRQTYALLGVILASSILFKPEYFSLAWAALPFGTGASLYWARLRLPKDEGLAIAAGALSYPVYLIHYPLGSFLAVAMVVDRGWPLFWASLAPILALSWLLWRFVEVPVEKFRKSLRSKSDGII